MPTDTTLLTVPFESDLGRLALALRFEVFVDEQKVPEEVERDAYDPTATHLVAIVDGDVVGTLRIVFLEEHAKIGRVAVRAGMRGQGIARAMMLRAMELARTRGETRFYLTAQTDKLGFYERLGFVAFGEEFGDGGLPHLAMKTY